MKNKEIGARLKELRGTRSQENFAQLLGITRTSLSVYERGTTPLNADLIIKVCEICSVTPNWLLLGEDIPLHSETKELERENIGSSTFNDREILVKKLQESDKIIKSYKTVLYDLIKGTPVKEIKSIKYNSKTDTLTLSDGEHNISTKMSDIEI